MSFARRAYFRTASPKDIQRIRADVKSFLEEGQKAGVIDGAIRTVMPGQGVLIEYELRSKEERIPAKNKIAFHVLPTGKAVYLGSSQVCRSPKYKSARSKRDTEIAHEAVHRSGRAPNEELSQPTGATE